uniref:Uncharacterized protein n=1 Tax=Anopheles quadriannulatus TaxID=34691 RepID=A0A182XSH8_ANOQN
MQLSGADTITNAYKKNLQNFASQCIFLTQITNQNVCELRYRSSNDPERSQQSVKWAEFIGGRGFPKHYCLVAAMFVCLVYRSST